LFFREKSRPSNNCLKGRKLAIPNHLYYIRLVNRVVFHTTLASSFSYDLNFTCESDAEYESSMTEIPFRGDKVSLRTEYFFSEDAPGSTYDNVNMFINEILLALAASGSGVLRLTEGQLPV